MEQTLDYKNGLAESERLFEDVKKVFLKRKNMSAASISRHFKIPYTKGMKILSRLLNENVVQEREDSITSVLSVPYLKHYSTPPSGHTVEYATKFYSRLFDDIKDFEFIKSKNYSNKGIRIIDLMIYKRIGLSWWLKPELKAFLREEIKAEIYISIVNTLHNIEFKNPKLFGNAEELRKYMYAVISIQIRQLISKHSKERNLEKPFSEFNFEDEGTDVTNFYDGDANERPY